MQKAGADVVAGTKFTDFIALHNGGDTDHECSVKLAEVVAGIRKTKQPGALSLRIDLIPAVDRIIRDAVDKVREQIREAVDVPVYAGTIISIRE